MSVAFRGKSGRSWMMSRRESKNEEDESAVGAVVVMLHDKTEDQNTAAYRIPADNNSHDDAKVIASSITQKETSFMAVLAPNCDAAMASLQNQPPGTYLLVKEEDAAITVYIKFRRAVRVWTLVKSKEVKKNDDAIQLAKVRKSDQDIFMQTPVHYLRLVSEVYFIVERCWKRFLPQVQAIVFELCCETQFDEDIKLEDWTQSMIPPSAYSLSLMPDTCGFYILTIPKNDADSSASIIQVRQVEFDFNKFVITVADGTLKPSALLLATSFTAKRTFEPDFTFGAIRDNFLTPDLVILKETSVNNQQSSIQNCLDLGSNDREFSVLSAADAACGSIMPHEPLPESLLSVLHEMHVYFVNTAVRDGTTPSSKPVLYSSQKMKLVGRTIPILLELLIASAALSETASSSNQMSVQAIAASENKKKQVLAQFAHSIRFDILFMTARSDESVICRLVHQFCQLLGARIRLPAELVGTIRDFVVLFPVFLRLFLRNQGIAALWKNIHHNELDKDADLGSESRRQSNSRSFRSLPTSTTVVNMFQSKGDRRPSMFGLGRKPHTKSRKSLSLGMNLTSTPFLSSKALAFFRLSPMSVQIYLGVYLREGYFTFPDVWKEDPVLAKNNFCSCSGQQFSRAISTMAGDFGTKTTTLCARTRLRSSPKLIVYELLLQLSLRFLYHKCSFSNWDRDVALLLRLEEIHRHLFDEIICIVRRRTEAQDIKTQEASFCELRVVITSVSTLFRLERKRRQEISSAVGEKKYASFIHFFRAKIRELNENLKLEASCDDHTDESASENHDQTEEGDSHILNALAEVFTWIPRAFLNEWIILSLKELLQSVNELSLVVKQPTILPHKQLQYVRHGYQICKVFAVILRRTSDPEIQTMLVRVLGMDCPAIISLLRFVLSPQSLNLNGGREAVCIQVHVLNFLTAFVNRDIALPVQSDWESNNRKPSDEDNINEDAEILEQLKGELLIRLLGPRIMTDDGEQSDQTLWEYLLELMFPDFGNNAVESFNAMSHMLSSAVAFRSLSTPPILLTSISRPHFEVKEAFTLLQQALYTAQDVSSQIDYEQCVASHWRRIEQYSNRIIKNEGQEEPSMVYRMVELDFRCLIVLASRRSQFPAIQDAFDRNHLLSSVLKRLTSRELAPQETLSPRSNRGSSDDDTTIPCLPPLRLPRLLSSGTSEVPCITKFSILSPHSTSSPHEQVNVEQNFILLEPGLHALAVVLLATYVIVDPNLEIDEIVCPRISVPGQAEADPNKPSELLWKLQNHLACVEMDKRYFEALMVEMKTLQVFVSTGRLSAIRSLLRLLCPSRFDCNMHTQGDSKQAREYVAKGAFSTVYRQYPELPRSVAIKVVEHQRRAGEMCAVSGLFNEVSILSKLRGNLAATQLVDFGNHHEEQNFEVVMEYCTCSLTEWRATIKRMDSEVPFRSCLIMILRAFEQACKCLTRIHQAGICHFDIKSDNILVRTSMNDLSRNLLDIQEKCADYTGWLCFADFGESKIVDSDRIPVRTFTFSSFSSGIASPVPDQKRAEKFMSLTRTRGTEAIKSPEVLKIKGSEVSEVKVTFASDIWSLGCLLYELVTQELVFQNDDWAGLYAHLVVTQDQDVLRSDHKQKIRDALNPTSNDEEAVVAKLLEFCSNILVREPTRRPKLETITDQVCTLINDVYALPVTSNDEVFILSLNQLNREPSTTEAQCPMPALRPITRIPSCRKQTQGVIVPVRLFWNFFLAANITRTHVTSCIPRSSGPASNDVLVMDVFEAKYEADFVHFVYFSWYQSGEASVHDISPNFIEELHEDEHRTCFQLNPLLKSTESTDLFQHLVQHASQYFPVIQRRLRDEAGCVVFVALGTDAEEIKHLEQVLVSSLFLFFRSALAMSPFDMLNYFGRDCAAFFEYPRREFLHNLMTFSRAAIEDTTSSTIQCRCGACIFTIDTSAFTQALSSRTFHPFPMHNADFDDLPVDTMFMYDNAEEQVVYPLETRSKRGEEVPWITLDPISLGRSGPTSQTSSRASRFGIFKRGASKVAGETLLRPVDLELLLRGLQRGKLHDSSDTWELYECEVCRLPICAVSLDKLKVAVPQY